MRSTNATPSGCAASATSWRSCARTRPRLGLEELIDRAITRLGYDLAALMLPGGTRRLANVRKLMRMAWAYEATDGRDLRGFLDFLEESAGGPTARARPRPRPSSTTASA